MEDLNANSSVDEYRDLKDTTIVPKIGLEMMFKETMPPGVNSD